jgi:hypothetical protein
VLVHDHLVDDQPETVSLLKHIEDVRAAKNVRLAGRGVDLALGHFQAAVVVSLACR